MCGAPRASAPKFVLLSSAANEGGAAIPHCWHQPGSRLCNFSKRCDGSQMRARDILPMTPLSAPHPSKLGGVEGDADRAVDDIARCASERQRSDRTRPETPGFETP